MLQDIVGDPRSDRNISSDLAKLRAALSRPNGPAQPVAPGLQQHGSVAFLMQFDREGWHNLVAFSPDTGRPVEARTFAPGSAEAMSAWVRERDGKLNLYFSVNEPRPGAPDKKLSKEDIARLRAVAFDRDLEPGEPLDSGKLRLQALADQVNARVPATYVLDSGGGVQLFWCLTEKADAAASQAWAEAQGRGMARAFEGDAVIDINRIMRLPSTQNIPTEKKRAWGRVQVQARILGLRGPTYSKAQLANAVPPVLTPPTENTTGAIAEARDAMDLDAAAECLDLDSLPGGLSSRLRVARDTDQKLDALLRDGSAAKAEGDRTPSGLRASLAARLVRHGFDAQAYACIVHAWPPGWPNGPGRDGLTERVLSRDWGNCSTVGPQPFDVAAHFDAAAAAGQPADPPPSAGEGEAPTAAGSGEDLFEMLSLGEIVSRPPLRFVIGRHLPERSVGFLYGDPGTGKSFIALDWALHLAFGRADWHGDPIEADPEACVIYLAGEGAQGFKTRVLAWLKHRGIPESEIDGGRFKLIPAGVNMMSREEVKKLVRTIQRGVGRACLVIADTVSRSMPGADENAQKEMTLFVQACDVLRDAFGCVVLGVHHANRQGAMRGSSVLLGAGDFVFKLRRERGKPVGKLICEKQKDAPDGWEESYRFAVVEVEGGSSLVPVRCSVLETAAGPVTSDLTTLVMDAMQAAWNDGDPWGETYRAGDRHAVKRLVGEFGFTNDGAETALREWLDEGQIELCIHDKRTKRKGYRVSTYKQSGDDIFG